MLEKDSSIDLIVSDVMMPLMDGFSLLQKTRSHPRLGFLPFLMVTALVTKEDRLKALRLGVDGYLSKPFNTIELKTRVANLMRQQKARKNSSTAAINPQGQGPVTAMDPKESPPPLKAMTKNG